MVGSPFTGEVFAPFSLRQNTPCRVKVVQSGSTAALWDRDLVGRRQRVWGLGNDLRTDVE